MAAYPGNGLAKLLPANRQMYMWDSDTVPVATLPGSLSEAFLLERLPNVSYPWGLSFEVAFSGAPGAFEIDILGANNDTGNPGPGYYVQLGTIITVNASNVGRWDMASNMWPKFVAAYVKILTNSVLVTMTVTR